MRTYKVRAAGNRIVSDDRRANARHELFARNDLLAHQVTTALCLNLVLDMAGCDAGTDVLLYGARDHGGATEAVGLDQTRHDDMRPRALTQYQHQR